jgi:hypothetical protein
MKKPILKAVAAVALLGMAAPAQWLNRKTPGIPRTPDGKPDMTAPVPRTADGKPDLSGIWDPDPKYLRNLAVDLKPGEVPFQPWAEKLYNERKDGAHSAEEPDANCLPQGVPKIDTAPAPWKVMEYPGVVLILYEAFGNYRQIFTDGRPLPQDPNPAWFGYSIGKWEGDTLVVDSIGFNGKVWLDQVGHPSTDALHVIERYHRKDFGHMTIQVTIDDPKAYTRPWTVTEDPHYLADTELLEFDCNENNRDVQHLVDKKIAKK